MQERFTCLATAPCRHRAALAGQCICVSPSISSSARRKKWIRKQWGGTGLRREHLEIGIDLPTLVKGSHGFSPATVVRRLRSEFSSKPQLDVRAVTVDAFRSSMQAAPVTCFFQNLRVDKSNPTLEHVPSNWHPTAPLPHSYKCRYDPVHNAIRNRDRPVPLALCIIRVAELMHAPRPHIFSRQTSSPHTSGGGCNGDLN